MTGELSDSLRLRAATSLDESFLRRVYASTRAEELALAPWTEEEKEKFTSQQFAAQDAHYRTYYPTSQFLVIEHRGENIGRLYIDHWSRETRIMDISILPQYRGTGIGTELIRQMQEEARTAGKSLSIHVEKLNPALRLYERLGFRTKEDKGVYLLMEWNG